MLLVTIYYSFIRVAIDNNNRLQFIKKNKISLSKIIEIQIKFVKNKIKRKMFTPDIEAKITAEELQKLHDICLQTLKSGELHTLRNDAKFRAVNTTKSYDEFK